MAMNNTRPFLAVPMPTILLVQWEKEKMQNSRNSWHHLIGSCWRNPDTLLDIVILTGVTNVLSFSNELCNYSFSGWNIIALFFLIWKEPQQCLTSMYTEIWAVFLLWSFCIFIWNKKKKALQSAKDIDPYFFSKWNNPDTETQTLHDSPYIWNLTVKFLESEA